MKDGRHPWGVFERRFVGRGIRWRLAWVLVSHHKTSTAAARRSRSGQIVRRISNFRPMWER